MYLVFYLILILVFLFSKMSIFFFYLGINLLRIIFIEIRTCV